MLADWGKHKAAEKRGSWNWYKDSTAVHIEDYQEAECPICGGKGIVNRRINHPSGEWTDVSECKHCGVNIGTKEGKFGDWKGVRERKEHARSMTKKMQRDKEDIEKGVR